nr:hypothetical protein B296_00031614 [Ipomoea batatas]
MKHTEKGFLRKLIELELLQQWQICRTPPYTLTAELYSKLFPVPARKEKCHVPLNNKAIVTVPDLAMAIPNTSWSALPYQLSTICSYLQTVGVITCFVFITHKPEKSHVNRGHAKLECLKVKAEILTKTMEDLTDERTHTNFNKFTY